MNQVEIMEKIQDTIKYGGHLEYTTIGLATWLNLCGGEGWVNAVRREVFEAWEQDYRRAEGFWIDKEAHDFTFNKAALLNHKELFSRFVGEDAVLDLMNFFDSFDRKIHTWNALIDAYGSCSREGLHKWADILEQAEQSEDRDIELCIIAAELNSRKLHYRMWRPLRNAFFTIRNDIKCRLIAAYISKAPD